MKGKPIQIIGDPDILCSDKWSSTVLQSANLWSWVSNLEPFKQYFECERFKTLAKVMKIEITTSLLWLSVVCYTQGYRCFRGQYPLCLQGWSTPFRNTSNHLPQDSVS